MMRYRLAVFSRVAAAILGGYALASAAAACLAVWLPMGRADAVTTASGRRMGSQIARQAAAADART
jgi:hypothetical protein